MSSRSGGTGDVLHPGDASGNVAAGGSAAAEVHFQATLPPDQAPSDPERKEKLIEALKMDPSMGPNM